MAILDQIRAACAAGLRSLSIATDGIGLFPGPLSYTIAPENANGNENHFQGIAALGDGVHYVVTGSNWMTGRGDVFGFQVDPASGRGQCVAHRQIEAPLWHASGCAAWGDVVAIPAELPIYTTANPGRFTNRADPPQNPGPNRSAIFFFRGPSLEPLDVRIDRADSLATSVAFAQLATGRFALIALAQPAPPAVQVDAYLTPGTTLDAGFQHVWRIAIDQPPFDNFDSMSLLTGPTEVVLAAFSGTSSGTVIAYRFEPELTTTWPAAVSIPVQVGPATFEAGGCLTPLDGALALTAVGRYRSPGSKVMLFTQRRAPVPAAPVVIAATG